MARTASLSLLSADGNFVNDKVIMKYKASCVTQSYTGFFRLHYLSEPISSQKG